VAERAEPSSSKPFVELGTGEDGPAREPTRDSVGFFRPAREYEFDEASLEEHLTGPIMDAVQALTPADYLGLSTVGCIPTEDMIASLVRLQTMVNCFFFLFFFYFLCLAFNVLFSKFLLCLAAIGGYPCSL
jgi:hypothetical protein